MVAVTVVLNRIPVIKFRKGGLARPGGPAPSAAAAAPAAAAPASAPTAPPAAGPVAQQSAPMSTGAMPDFNIPPRYMRAPLTDEEIEIINGGGVK